MATRKDPRIKENTERGAEKEQDPAGIDSRSKYNDDDGVHPGDTIKNAHAAGLGAIGRNDQQQTEDTSNHAADAGNE